MHFRFETCGSYIYAVGRWHRQLLFCTEPTSSMRLAILLAHDGGFRRGGLDRQPRSGRAPSEWERMFESTLHLRTATERVGIG